MWKPVRAGGSSHATAAPGRAKWAVRPNFRGLESQAQAFHGVASGHHPSVPRRAGHLLLVFLVLLLGAGSATAAPANGQRATYLRAAEQGMQAINRLWWNPKSKWYTTYPYKPKWGKGGLATLWDVAPVFETVSLIGLADPNPNTRKAVESIAIGAERYWNPQLKPLGGYGYLPDMRGDGGAFFDDNGWWGLAFFDAYRATGERRFLRDAERAFWFIVDAGWAKGAGGGVWWHTDHTKKTAEPLAAAALMGAEMYESTHSRTFL